MMVAKCLEGAPATALLISVSDRVRPMESRNILPCVSWRELAPSGVTCMDSFTISAENGAPAMERKLIPSDSVLAERLLMKRLFEEIALLLVCPPKNWQTHCQNTTMLHAFSRKPATF
jgi:hypothetical protein